MSKLIAKLIFGIIKLIFRDKTDLVLENLALRHQLSVLERKKKPKLKNPDRIFWAWLSRIWPSWKSPLILIKPETVIKWHRKGFKLYWRWKCRHKVGRPTVPKEIRNFIRQMRLENPTWGTPRIHSELLLLGYDICETTISNYMVRQKKPPSQTWKTFLKNHAIDITAVDFFTVPTATFRILYCFIVICHHRRKIVHFNVTYNPTAKWTTQQITEAFPYDSALKYLIRDRDRIYGDFFVQRVNRMGIKEVKIAPKSPWQNAYAERVIGSIRRECLNHFIIFNEKHLLKILDEYVDYYNNCRTHLSLDKNSPMPREVEKPEQGKVTAIPKVGGLHHLYKRVA